MGVDWFPLWLSLRVAALSTLLAFLGGLGVAWAISRRDFRGRFLLESLVTLPLLLPPTVLGYYLLVLLGQASPVGRVWESVFGEPLVFTWRAAVVASLIHSAPLLIQSARAALENVPVEYEQAARALGASEFRVFWAVSLPLAWSPVLAATVLAFARSLGEFGITLMLAGNIPGQSQTLSVAIYDAVASGNGDAARVLVLVISGLAILFLSIANRIGRTQFGRVQ